MRDADMIEAMARTEAPDFIEGLQGFASMCERSLSIEDGPMLAAKFRDVAFCISIAKVELDRLRAENARLRSALLDAREFVEVEHERREDSCLDADHEYLSEVYDLAAKIDAVLFPRAALSPSPADGEGR